MSITDFADHRTDHMPSTVATETANRSHAEHHEDISGFLSTLAAKIEKKVERAAKVRARLSVWCSKVVVVLMAMLAWRVLLLCDFGAVHAASGGAYNPSTPNKTYYSRHSVSGNLQV